MAIAKRGAPEKIKNIITATEDFEKNEKNWKKLGENSPDPKKRGEKISGNRKKGDS